MLRPPHSIGIVLRRLSSRVAQTMALANDAGERIWAAVTDPEILIGTFSYLLLKPLLRNSGLVDEKKGAYRTSMIWSVAVAVARPCTQLAVGQATSRPCPIVIPQPGRPSRSLGCWACTMLPGPPAAKPRCLDSEAHPARPTVTGTTFCWRSSLR
eukprot:scaffold24105_cov113-Isochrysis_galbana.AAC.5